jgi:hypothetical protein
MISVLAESLPSGAAEQIGGLLGPQLLGSIVGCFIWLPYLFLSRRVKRTFFR